MSKSFRIIAAIALGVIAACRSDRDGAAESHQRATGPSPTAQSTEKRSAETTGRIEASAERPSVKISNEDRDFVTKAASVGRFEIESSQLALEKTQNSETRTFAQQLIDDHTRSSRELESLASQKGISLMHALATKDALMLDRLRGSNTGEFDREYHQVQVDAHRGAIELFERAARDASDADLSAFAQRTLPTLRSHLAHVQEMDTDKVR